MAAEVSEGTIHTLLLAPAVGDVTLLAGEPGDGVVPQVSLWLPSGDVADHLVDLVSHLLLVYDGQPVPMGCDRTYRVARPVHDARRMAAWIKRDARARSIYAGYARVEAATLEARLDALGPNARVRARRAAFEELAVTERADLTRVPGVLSHSYTVEDAVTLARWAADLLGATVVALDAEGQELPLSPTSEETP